MEETSNPVREHKPSAPSHSQKPDMAGHVPQRQQGESQTPSRGKPQSEGDKKPKGRPRYTDKARRYNSKNKKDKKETQNGAITNGEKEEGKVNDKSQVEKEADSKEEAGQRVTSEDLNTTTCTSSESKSAESEQNLRKEKEEEKKEEEESDNWDSLFTDDGECLDPHLLEEV